MALKRDTVQTIMCINVLKEIIKHLNIKHLKSCSTSVFVTFFDASKVYDKFDHWQFDC